MVKILCYGDSLTAGFYNNGFNFCPYGNFLGNKLGESVKSIGMSGWRTGKMLEDSNKENNIDVAGISGNGLRVLLTSESFDIVCLMAGTNDIGMNIAPEIVLSNLSNLMKCCLSNENIKVVMLTIPPTCVDAKYDHIREKRLIINEGIAKMCLELYPRAYLIDTNGLLKNPGRQVFNIENTSEFDLWDTDLLHLSPNRSAKLGEFVYDNLMFYNLLN